MKCKLNVIQGVLRLDLDNSIGSLQGFNEQLYQFDKYTANSIADVMGFNKN